MPVGHAQKNRNRQLLWWKLAMAGGIFFALLIVLAGIGLVFYFPPFSAPPQSYCLGTDFPTSIESAHGTPSENGADLAIAQNRNLSPGYTLDACNEDNTSRSTGTHNAATGVQNMNRLVANSRVLGVVGPQDSDVALAEIPVAARASLAMVSPAAMDPCLTLPQYCVNSEQVHPLGVPNAFFRICGNNSQQGQALASLLFQNLRASRSLLWMTVRLMVEDWLMFFPWS